MTRLTSVSIKHRRQASELGRQMEQAATNIERLHLANEAVRLLELAKQEEALAQRASPSRAS